MATTDGACGSTDAERSAFEREGRPSTVRFAMPERDWVVDDLVKGEVRFPQGQLRDFVLVRSDGSPVFLLAVAVDDMLMEVTHVIRGDDLLASAPRNAAVIEALGGTAAAVRAPAAGARDGRQAAVQAPRLHVGRGVPRAGVPAGGVDELPGAARMVEGRVHDVPLARRARSRRSTCRAYRATRPRSTRKKLEWMNNHYIQSLGEDELAARCLHFLTEAGLLPDPSTLRAAMPIVRERMKTLTDSVDAAAVPVHRRRRAGREGAGRPSRRRRRGTSRRWPTRSTSSSRGSTTRSWRRSTRSATAEGLNRSKGFAAGPRRRDRLQGVAAAAGVPGAARARGHGRPSARGRGMRRALAVLAAGGAVDRRPARPADRGFRRTRAFDTRRPPADRVEADPVRRAAAAGDGRVLASALRRRGPGGCADRGDRRALHGRHDVLAARGRRSRRTRCTSASCPACARTS